VSCVAVEMASTVSGPDCSEKLYAPLGMPSSRNFTRLVDRLQTTVPARPYAIIWKFCSTCGEQCNDAGDYEGSRLARCTRGCELIVVFQVSQDLTVVTPIQAKPQLLAAIQVCAVTGTNRLPGRVENGEDRAACPDHVIVQQFLMLPR
jgi:hypothetical protein